MRLPHGLPEGTKFEILNLLLKQELGADALAERLAVTGAAVRQHLDTLRALGLVLRRKVSAQPGRPAFLYQLSPMGRRAFPKRYDLLLGLLLETLVERHGLDTVAEVVAAAARRLAERVRDRFRQGAERERWALLFEWLEEELAWRAEVREEGGVRRVVLHHCPFQDVSREHPAVCGVFFRTLVQALYGEVPVEHVPARAGPACCELVVAVGDAPRSSRSK